MERGDGLLENPMTNVEVRAAVNTQKAAAKQSKLTYRGVTYLKKVPTLGN
jgi:hypothetical protein